MKPDTTKPFFTEIMLIAWARGFGQACGWMSVVCLVGLALHWKEILP